LIVAVSGGSGFAGRFVVERLMAAGHNLRCLVRPTTDRSLVPLGASTVEGDLDERPSLRRLLKGADAFVSVASLGFGHAPKLIEACEAESVRRAVFFSTTSIYTRLESTSKATRIAAEGRIEGSRLAWTILRPTMIYGTERDRNISRLIRFLRRAPVVPLPGGGQALVQPVHVEDLAVAVGGVLSSAAAEKRAYNLSGAQPVSLRDLVAFILSKLSRRPAMIAVPIGPMAFLAGLWRRTDLPPRISKEQVLRLAEDKAVPFEEARADFGFEPRSWSEGVSAEIARLKEIGWIR
jgi:nucleoside-diphosphate-sugar epimerase